MTENQVKILEGNTFVVSDQRGDIEASRTDPTGLFSFDTRFPSTWVLNIDGERLTPLSVDDLEYFETRFFLVPGTGTVDVDAKLSVIRRCSVRDGFCGGPGAGICWRASALGARRRWSRLASSAVCSGSTRRRRCSRC
jgi:hypothetical protein